MTDNYPTIFDTASDGQTSHAEPQNDTDKAKLFGSTVLNKFDWQKVQREDPAFYFSGEGKALREQHRKQLGINFYSKKRPNLSGLLKDLGQ